MILAGSLLDSSFSSQKKNVKLVTRSNIEATWIVNIFTNNPDQLKIQTVGLCFMLLYHNLHSV